MNSEISECGDYGLLVEYKNGRLDQHQINELTPHLITCDICMLTLELLPEDEMPTIEKRGPRKPLNSISLQKFKSEGLIFKKGQVWSTKTEDIMFPTADAIERYSTLELGGHPYYVVISDPSVEGRKFQNEQFRVVRVVPITENVWYAIEGDIIIPAEKSLFGYPMMLENWNEQEMLAENLDSLVNGRAFDPKPIGNPGEYSFFSLIKNGKYGDPKMRFRSREFKRTGFLRDPVISLRDAVQISLEQLALLRVFLVMAKSKARHRYIKADSEKTALVRVDWRGRTIELNILDDEDGIEVCSSEGDLVGKTLILRQIDGDLELKAVFERDPTEGREVSAFLLMPDDLLEETANSMTLSIEEENDELE